MSIIFIHFMMKSKYILNRKILIPVFVTLILLCNYFIPNHFLFSIISILFVSINVLVFIKEKNELKSSICYARTVSPKKYNLWNLIKNYAPIILFAILVIVFYKELNEIKIPIYFYLILIPVLFEIIHSNFNDSIRAFDAGVILPNYKNGLITWKEISSINIQNLNFIINLKENKVFTFIIDERDFLDAKNINDLFEKQTII